MDKSFKYVIPFAIFFALISFLWKGTNGSQEDGQEPVQLAEQQEEVPLAEQSVEKSLEQEILSVDGVDKAAKVARIPRTFQLPTVVDPNKTVTQDIFKGHVTILNTWASWCGACRKGHDALLALSKGSGSEVYWVGLNLNDKLEDAQWMLDLYGNPYNETIYDKKGQLSVDYGLRGTPELLILDKEGRVQHRHMGLINEVIWREELLPIIKSLQ